VLSSSAILGVEGSTGDNQTSVRWHGLIVHTPGVYQVCWCGNASLGACEEDLDFGEPAGVIQVRGPFGLPDAYLSPAAGEVFVLALRGLGFAEQDRIRIVESGVACGGIGASASVETLRGPPGCAGGFSEQASRAGNARDRPHVGTPCAAPCVQERGRWGHSWCWTEPEGTSDRQWGAPCVDCMNAADALDVRGIGSQSFWRWVGLSIVEVGSYRVCWCAGGPQSCLLDDMFDIEVAMLDVWGPSPKVYACLMDRACLISMPGVPPHYAGSAVKLLSSSTACDETVAQLESDVMIPGVRNPQTNPDANASAYTRFRLSFLQSRVGRSVARISELVLWSSGQQADLEEATVNITSDNGAEVCLEENRTSLSNFNISLVMIELPQPFRIDAFSFATGPSEDDDPVAFELEGSSEARPWSSLVRISGYQTPLARLTQSGMVSVHNGITVYGIGIPSGGDVGNYTLCWANHIDGLFTVNAGTLSLTGISGQQDQWCFAGTRCTLGPVAGVGLSRLDQVVAVTHFES